LSVTPAPIRALPAPLPVPPGLSAAEGEVWRQTVASLPPGWLAREMGPLLERFCCHTVRARCIEALLVQVDPMNDLQDYARLSRLAGEETARILALARALRLTVQSRLHSSTAGNRSAGSRPQPDISVLFGRTYGDETNK
jgi:hypothetical protein